MKRGVTTEFIQALPSSKEMQDFFRELGRRVRSKLVLIGRGQDT